jgi:Uma2 family endonuclease
MSITVPFTAPAGSLTVAAPGAPPKLAEIVHRLGDIPLDRIWAEPPPGTATVPDLLECEAKYGCLCELVDGVIVEKAMAYREGMIEAAIITAMVLYNQSRKLGKITTGSAMHQLKPSLVRLPDVAFTFWNRYPGGRVPDDPAPFVVPDVAVEVLSPSNTRREMERKRAEYFAAGTQLVWMVDLEERTVTVFTAPEQFTVLHETETLDGGSVLPGFTLSLQELFAQLDEQGPPQAT